MTRASQEMILGEAEADHVERYWNGFLPSKADMQQWSAACPVHNPVENKDEGRAPYGQLTTLGAQELAQIGASLRRRYGTFRVMQSRYLQCNTTLRSRYITSGRENSSLLPDKCEPSRIYTTSTPFYRTQQSAQNMLLGTCLPSVSHMNVF